MRKQPSDKYPESTWVRPGLRGRTGKVFAHVLNVFQWVMKYNPQCEYFGEHLKFDDDELADDWAKVCSVIGIPVRFDAADYSGSRRVREYWSNFLPIEREVIEEGFKGKIESEQCMDRHSCHCFCC